VQHGALPDLVAEGRVDATALSVAAGNPRVTKWLHDAARDASRCASGNSEHPPPSTAYGSTSCTYRPRRALGLHTNTSTKSFAFDRISEVGALDSSAEDKLLSAPAPTSVTATTAAVDSMIICPSPEDSVGAADFPTKHFERTWSRKEYQTRGSLHVRVLCMMCFKT
jgi:hypothetical protein